MESNKNDTQEKDSQGGGISIKRFFEYFKIISLVALVFSLTTMLIFSMTYANEYKVPLTMYFSDFWLFGWVFGLFIMSSGLISPMFSMIGYRLAEGSKETRIEIVAIFISSMILAKVSISFYCFVYIFLVLWAINVLYYFFKLYKRKEENHFFILSICMASLLVYIFAVAIFGLGVPNPNWTYFCIYITLSLAVVSYSIIKFFYKKDNILLLLAFSFFIFLMILGALAYKDCFTEGFKQLLIKNNIATEETKIYIKDENRPIVGKIIFQNSTHALVESKCDLKNCAVKECNSKLVTRDWFLIENIIILQDSFSGKNSTKNKQNN